MNSIAQTAVGDEVEAPLQTGNEDKQSRSFASLAYPEMSESCFGRFPYSRLRPLRAEQESPKAFDFGAKKKTDKAQKHQIHQHPVRVKVMVRPEFDGQKRSGEKKRPYQI